MAVSEKSAYEKYKDCIERGENSKNISIYKFDNSYLEKLKENQAAMQNEINELKAISHHIGERLCIGNLVFISFLNSR